MILNKETAHKDILYLFENANFILEAQDANVAEYKELLMIEYFSNGNIEVSFVMEETGCCGDPDVNYYEEIDPQYLNMTEEELKEAIAEKERKKEEALEKRRLAIERLNQERKLLVIEAEKKQLRELLKKYPDEV